MRRKFNKFSDKGKFEPNSIFKGTREFKYQPPVKEKKSEESLIYNFKAFRDLQNVGNIEMRADPNSSKIMGSYPYNIINRTNKVVDANYAGKDNIDGNILVRLQNSNNSQLLNYYDICTINVRINYLYLCYSTNDTTRHNNIALNREMLKTVNEAISKAYSTMTTELPFYTNIMEGTDAPNISGLSAEENAMYGRLMVLLYYQTMIQNGVSPLSKYIETMSLEQHALDMAYRRESPLLTQLFGLLHKSAFKAAMNGIGTTLIGEYFDENWYKQMNLLLNTPSRKSNSMTDPLLTATFTTRVPHVKMKLPPIDSEHDPEPYFDSDDIKCTGVFINPDSANFDYDAYEDDLITPKATTLSFEETIYRLNRFLDISTILKWVRMVNTNSSSIQSNFRTVQRYYNNIINLIDNINNMLTQFTTRVSDIRTFLDKLGDSGMVYWKKGLYINVNDIKLYDPTYNVILHNMIGAYVGGASKMFYDTNTQRWQCTTLWNKYEGIAEFDKKSGGSFLTFGLRNLDLGQLVATDTAMCVPIVFADALVSGSNKCEIISRLGLSWTLDHDNRTNLSDDKVLSRLDPLGTGFSVKIPKVDISSYPFSSNENKAKVTSAILVFMGNLLGYGHVKTSATTYETILDPDYLCFIDCQIEDVSNEMIQFCRNYGVFRVSTPDGKRTMGFGF